MLGTSISSVTFLALPAAAYVLDYRQAVSNLAMPVAAVLAIVIFIPFFRQGRMTSAFEYLEERYGVLVRSYAALSFVMLQGLRLAIVLYLVSIPIAGMLGMKLIPVILIGGVVVAFYTALGGIEAVIWTDVVQTIILLLGGILCVLCVALRLPDGLPDVFRIGEEYHKFSLGPLDFGFGERTLSLMVLLGLMSFISEYTSNQNIVQRWLAAGSTREARKATLLCAFLSVPTWLLFYFLGTSLFAFYHIHPALLPEATVPEGVLPHFITTQLPAGMGGVIIAACLAAAMSTLSSSINGISSVATVDFVRRFRPETGEAGAMRWAKAISWLTGALMIAGAIVIDGIPRESIADFTLTVGSIFGGGMLAIYLLGLFVPRVGNLALWTGLAAGLLFNLYMGLNTLGVLPQTVRLVIHPYWTTILVNGIVLALALAASLKRRKQPEGFEYEQLHSPEPLQLPDHK
jgi:SSS family solute:Na+ symporter